MVPRKPILLAEDDPNDLELMLMAFRKINLRREIVVTHDGAETLDYLYCRGDFAGRERASPAMLLLDLKMPKLNGLDVLRRVKRDPRLRTLPVVMFSSSPENDEMLASYYSGVNAYVVKPLDFDQFIRVVRCITLFCARAGARLARTQRGTRALPTRSSR
jgi:CheY-like chemotaxis protein